MRTNKALYRTTPMIYNCELDMCPQCKGTLVEVGYLNGLKTIQTMTEVLTMAYRPKQCTTPACRSNGVSWPSAGWQQVAPKYGTYGYDVIAQIGWARQKSGKRFAAIHSEVAERIKISEAQVRFLYHQRYLPLLACHERQHWQELEAVSRQSGLLLGLDGLMPEGGEPQLWVVRELHTGWTLRSGWMSCQDETAFIEFLQPIADSGLLVKALISDKQRGLLPAVNAVFPQAVHGFCQLHYLKNAAEPVAQADEQMKIDLRQKIRAAVGDVIRQKQAEKPTVLTVTGMIPTPVVPSNTHPPLDPTTIATRERETIIADILHRVRYLLALKGHPPFRLAGIEMFARLQEVTACVQELLQQQAEPRLLALQAGLQQALHAVSHEQSELCQAAKWLANLAQVLDPDQKPARSAEQVREEWQTCLANIQEQGQASPRLQEFSAKIGKVSASYAPGLFHTYDVPGLPRTNNGRESEFRDLRRRLLSTTGQIGAVKRLLSRVGAWELIPGLNSLLETVAAIAHVERDQFLLEQQRIQSYLARFRLHTRSAKQSQTQLKKLAQRWKALGPINSP